MSNPYEPAPSTPEPTPPAAATPPAGWYADPSGTGGMRWWDGTVWTENVHPPTPPAPPVAPVAPVAAVVPEAPAAPVPPAPEATYAPAAAAAAYPAYGSAPGYAPAYQAGYVQPRKVGFGEAVKRAFSGWSDYSSRATVAEYWWFVLFEMIIAIPLYILFFIAIGSSFTATTDENGNANVTSNGLSGLGIVLLLVIFVVYLLFFIVGLALAVRRLHDTDKSGWWYFISFVPFGGLVLLIFFIMGGTPGPNRYGPMPQ